MKAKEAEGVVARKLYKALAPDGDHPLKVTAFAAAGRHLERILHRTQLRDHFARKQLLSSERLPYLDIAIVRNDEDLVHVKTWPRLARCWWS